MKYIILSLLIIGCSTKKPVRTDCNCVFDELGHNKTQVDCYEKGFLRYRGIAKGEIKEIEKGKYMPEPVYSFIDFYGETIEIKKSCSIESK